MPAWSEKHLEAHFAAKMRLPDGRRLVLVKACMGGVGGVDLLCLDERANLVLIEAKSRRAGRKTMAQLISYLYAVKDLTVEDLIAKRARFTMASANARLNDPVTQKLFFKTVGARGLRADFEAKFERPLKKLGSMTYAYILAPRFYDSTLDMIPWLETHFAKSKFGTILATPSIDRASRKSLAVDGLKFVFS